VIIDDDVKQLEEDKIEAIMNNLSTCTDETLDFMSKPSTCGSPGFATRFDSYSEDEYQRRQRTKYESDNQLCRELSKSIITLSSCSNELSQIANVLSCCRQETTCLDGNHDVDNLANDDSIYRGSNNKEPNIISLLRHLEESLCDVEDRVNLFKGIVNQENEALCEIERNVLRLPNSEEPMICLKEVSEYQYSRIALIHDHLEQNPTEISEYSKHEIDSKENFVPTRCSVILNSDKRIETINSPHQRSRKSANMRGSPGLCLSQDLGKCLVGNDVYRMESSRKDVSISSFPSDEDDDGHERKRGTTANLKNGHERMKKLNRNGTHSSGDEDCIDDRYDVNCTQESDRESLQNSLADPMLLRQQRKKQLRTPEQPPSEVQSHTKQIRRVSEPNALKKKVHPIAVATSSSVQRMVGQSIESKRSQNDLFSLFRVPLIEHAELTEIPTTMRGRICVPVLNDALFDILKVCLDHYQHHDYATNNNSSEGHYQNTNSSYPRHGSRKKDVNRGNTYDDGRSKQQQKIVITEQELRTSCAFFRTGESSARSILLVLRALGRLQQVPSKKTDQILYSMIVSYESSMTIS
jgi:hypothetical protein